MIKKLLLIGTSIFSFCIIFWIFKTLFMLSIGLSALIALVGTIIATFDMAGFLINDSEEDK